MANNDEKSSNGSPRPNGCHNCRFSVAAATGAPEGVPLVGVSVLECRRNPPSFLMLNTPQGVVTGFGFPRVHDEIFCYSFENANTQEFKRNFLERKNSAHGVRGLKSLAANDDGVIENTKHTED